MNLRDKKAKNYARYNENLNEIQKQSFDEFKKLNINFKDKKIIDIGCGTGVWTLHLAKLAKEILAVDNSSAMLEILEQDSKNNNILNIKTINNDFKTFCKDNTLKFDIAFLSMSPALADESDYVNFLNLASHKIYLGWADYRKSDFLDPIFKYFKTEFKGFYKIDFESYLLDKNVNFYKFVFDEVRITNRSKDEAIENALWHLDMNGIKANKDDLKDFIKGDIKETISSKIKLIIC